MNPNAPVVYIETSVILALLRNEPDRVGVCSAAFADAEAGAIRANTSAFTLAEVIKLPEQAGYLPESAQAAIEQFFQHSWLRVALVDRRVGSLARQLAVAHGLKPPDAVHVATAQLYGAQQLFTYDERILRANGSVQNMEICEPRGQIRLGI